MTVVAFFHPGICFEPTALKLMGEAFDKACAEIRCGEPLAVSEEALAKQIIVLASIGERDPDRLCQAALTVFGVER